MNKTCLLLIFLELFLGFSVSAQSEEINLSGRKDRVLPISNRQIVLDVTEGYLTKEGDDFLSVIAEVKNPYVYEVKKKIVRPTRKKDQVEAPKPVAPTVYDDASVLKAVASNFSTQVRGTMAKGTTRYLQLQGGGLMKPGVSFPVNLPKLKGQSFTVTLENVDARGYTLRLEDSELYVPFEESSESPGAVKFNDE